MVLRTRDIMHTDILSVDEGASILDVARRMSLTHHGYALVVREGRPVGIVTEWDFVSRVLAVGRDPARNAIREIATSPLVSCDAETPTEDLVRLMQERGVRRMLVTRGDTVVGVVGARDVLASFQKYVDRISSDIARMTAPPEQ